MLSVGSFFGRGFDSHRLHQIIYYQNLTSTNASGFPAARVISQINSCDTQRKRWIRTAQRLAVTRQQILERKGLGRHSEVVRRALCHCWNGATVKISAETIVALIKE